MIQRFSITLLLLLSYTIYSQKGFDTSATSQKIKQIKELLEKDIEKAKAMIIPEIKAAEQCRDIKSYSKLFSLLIKYYEFKGYTDTVILLSPKAIKYARAAKDTGLTINDYLTCARAFSNIGNFKEAISQCLLAQRFSENFNSSKIQIKVLHDLAFIYNNLDSHDKSLAYYKKAISIAYQTKDSFNIANLSARIGGEYNNLALNDSSLFYNQQSYEYFNALNHKRGRGVALTNLSSSYAALKQNDKAIKTSLEAIKIRQELNDDYALIILNNNLADLYYDLNEFELALKYAKITKAYLLKNEDHNMYIQNATTLAKIYYALEDFKNAYKYRTIQTKKLQEVYNSTNVKALSELQTKYETEKKEKEIELLQLKNKNDNEKAVLEKKQHKYIIAFILVALMIILIFSMVLYKRFKISQKQKLTIQKQKLLVDQKASEVIAKQKDIMDSIKYAQRIQQAQLPTENYIKKHLS
ncbi:MAG: tetratricopeptide repeat protein [Bacteroidota bacterium]|jgi:tetratricopeptide (TPR) repeat protein|nr:tetratricopeptide repeat protein [Bacteroidota bacterium]MCA6443092.1 tetratricopeptide repeat protein [Bacteroidota bacterium]